MRRGYIESNSNMLEVERGGLHEKNEPKWTVSGRQPNPTARELSPLRGVSGSVAATGVASQPCGDMRVWEV